MYQKFDTTSHIERVPERIARLRDKMRRLKLDAFLIPRGDEHRGEYVAPSSERLAWVTGFTKMTAMLLNFLMQHTFNM